MQPYLIAGLWLVYLMLTGNYAPPNLVVGLLVALGITWLLHPGRPGMRPRRAATAAWAFARYVGVMVGDIVVGGLQVARIVLDPRLPLQPGVVAIRSDCDDELDTALAAHAISLAPGELVVEIDAQGVLYTHTLDATHAAETIAEAQRLRAELLSRIFP